MTDKEKKTSSKISRREFLKDAGILVGGAAIGSTVLLSACGGGETVTDTVTNTATVTSTAPGTTSTVTQTQTQTNTMTETQTATKTNTATQTVTQTATKTVTPDLATIEWEILNPVGQPDPIELVPLAPRLDTLTGKVIYIADVNFTATHQFMVAMEKIFNEKYPNTETRLKIKAGSYAAADPDLWQEIADQGDAMVMSVGH